MLPLLRWLVSITIILSFNCLISCQLLGALDDTLGGVLTAVDTLLVPAATTPQTTVVQDIPTAAAPVATTPAPTTQQQAQPQTTANVVVTNVLKTTVIQSKATVITSKVSLPILPSLTADGATTWTVGSDIYTVNVKNGKTSILGPTATDGKTVRLSQSIVGGMPVIISFMDVTQTVIGTSLVTQTASQISAPSSTAAKPTTTGIGAGAGIGIGVGLSVLLLGAAGLLVFFMKRRKAQSTDHSSVKGMMGAASDVEDGTSTTSPTFEKAELDGHSIHFVQHEPIELLGDIPMPQEIDGRELYAPETPKTTLARMNTLGSDGALVSPLDGTFPRTPEGAGIRRMDTVSTMHSPLDRNNSIRDEKWPPMPPPYRDDDR